ncbi:MAG: hypothetical protein J2P26_07165 [Nocardiopsaceae bacterium]|nr:hypothetical protein [Nocardiopsaceae bacterium]
MFSRAVVCPSPPLLAAGLTGRAAVVPDLSRACAAAVARLLDGGPETVAVVAGGPATRTWDPGSRLDRAAYGPGLPRGTVGLPLGLGIGAMLLDEAGYTGTRLLQAVASGAEPEECLALGAALADRADRTGLLVVGDGTARRTPKAPGHFDQRAAGFDAAAERALRSGDLASLAGLDPRLAAELMATGRAAWQVLAGAMSPRPASPGRPPGPPARGEVLYAAAPFGVGYLVAVLDP